MRRLVQQQIEILEGRTLLSATVSGSLNYSAGFTTAAALKLNGVVDPSTPSPAAIVSGHLRMADTKASERRSAFTTTAQPIANFTTTFTFQQTAGASGTDGLTFTIQNAGTSALGTGGGSLGYETIGRSVAIKFDLFKNYNYGDPSANCTGLFTNGLKPTGGFDLGPSLVNLHSSDIMRATLSYNGATLTETLTDTKTGKAFSHAYAVNIPSLVGGTSAYLGFTAASGARPCVQDVLTWTYSGTAPAPAVLWGTVFNDANGDGARQSTEAGLANVRVFLDTNGDGIWQSTERSVLTNAYGTYTFSNVAPDAYRIGQVVQTGWKQTAPSAGDRSITALAGATQNAGLFGQRKI